MAGAYLQRLTLLVVTRIRGASGEETTSTSDGTVFGATVSTVNPLQSSVNGEVDRDGVIVQAVVRLSPLSEAVTTDDYMRLDGDIYRVDGVSKGSFGRREITYTLRRAGVVQ